MEVTKSEKKATAELWKRFHQTGETDFRDKLIVQFLYLVKYVVGRLGTSLPAHVKLDDLYSSGVTGLIKAVEKFDPTKNSKFESYAILLIKGAIIDELRELDWIPRSIHQKASQIATATASLQQTLGRDPTDNEISHHLGISDEEYEELIYRVRPAILIPLNGETYHNSDEEQASISERIPDTKAETSFEVADRNEFSSLLGKAIADLPDQERRVLILYYYEGLMLKEIGKILHVSESRVSQIHTKALLKLKGRLQLVANEYVLNKPF